MKKSLLLTMILFPTLVLAGDCNAVFTQEAWDMIKDVIFALKIIVPVLLILLTTVDVATVVVKGSKEAESVSLQRIVIRVVSAILFFLVPTIVMMILELEPIRTGLNLVNDPTCGIFEGGN